LYKRRAYLNRTKQEKGEAAAAHEIAATQLKDLKTGAIVLDVPTAIEAGKVDAETITRVDAESNWNLAVDNARGRHFPRRRTFGNR
jgi:nucleotide-binding universal stress UspA family protein